MKVYLTSTTAECISTAANLINPAKSFDTKPCYLFCEDKITLNQEMEIASRLGGFFGVEVLAFRRYISLSLKNANLLSKEASVMVIRKIIAELGDELKCFNPKSYKPNLALTIYETLSQLESAKVTPETLLDLIDNGGNISAALKNKLCDLYLIYKGYNEYLENNHLLDSNNYLSLMPSLIKNDGLLKDAEVVLVGFNSITKQREDIIEALNAVTKNLSIVILADENSEIYTNEALYKLKKLYSPEIIESKAKINKEARFIKQNLFDINVFSPSFTPLKTQNVTVYEAETVTEEVETVAKEILSQIKNGKRFKNLAVALGNLKEYAPTVKKVFNEYNIPYYIDSPTTLIEHPVSAYILNYLDLARRGLAVNDFMRFVSSGIFSTDKSLTDGLKNYILKNALSRGNLKKPFEYESESLAEYERLRSLVYSCYQYLRTAKTVSEIVYAIKAMLNLTGAFESIDELGEFMVGVKEFKTKDINDKIGEKVLNILNEMELIIGDSQITLNDFKNIFASGAMGTEISVIPLFNDAVFVGEAKDVKIKNASVLYFLGLTSEVPHLKTDTALLSDNDLLRLDELKVIVEPKIRVVNEREKETVATALIAFEEELVLSYPKIKGSGESGLKSEIIDYVLKMFDITAIKPKKLSEYNGNISVEDKKKLLLGFATENTALKEILKLTGGKKIEGGLERQIVASFYEAVEELSLNGVKEKADGLYSQADEEKRIELNGMDYFPNKKTSATKIEKYFKCPYFAFIENLLRLSDVETGDMKFTETGTLLHSLIEQYVEKIDRVADESSSNELVLEILEKILSSDLYKKYLNKPEYEFSFSQLKKEGKRVCYNVFNALSKSLFKPYLTEASFDEKSQFKPIKLSTKKGEYKLTGKIDRVDVYDNNVRIIDYKSGTIDVKDESFYTGRKLQLYLYLKPFLEENFNPVGSYYFPVHDRFLEPKKKDYVMQGNTVDDDVILQASDVNLKQSGSSDVISVKIRKKDGKPFATSQTISQTEMKRYLDYAVLVSQNAIDEMNEGFIKPTPYKGACEYCKYGGMCGFDGNHGCTRETKGVTKETIIEAVNYEILKEAKDE